MGKKYKSSIKFDSLGENLGHYLDIEVTYEHPVTDQDYESDVSAFQKIFTQRAGREIPLEEISVKPRIGELRESVLSFRSQLESPVCPILEEVHRRAQYVLPKLIEELDHYQINNKLRYMDRRLVQHVINGLIEIVTPQKRSRSFRKTLFSFFSRN